MPIPAIPRRLPPGALLIRALLIRALLLGALLSGLTAPITAPALAATREERAQKFTAKAARAFDEGDITTAFKFANKALELNPRDAHALFVRGMLAFTVGGQVGGENGAKLMAAGVRDLLQVSMLAPDTEMGSIARDTVVAVTSRNPFPEPAYDCPPAAQAALDEAERWYSLHQPSQARAHYEAALQGCPQNANWWVFYGDVFFMAENYPGARQQYTKALERDPCNWMAHRFMADASAKEGNIQASYESLLRALTCNPGYAAAQQNLRSLVEFRRGLWLMNRAPVRSRQAAMGGTWAVLAEARKRESANPSGGPPLEQERAAVLETLAVWRKAPDGDFTWKLLSDAETRGELDSAIFLLLMDPALYGDYIPWRDSHMDELIRFLGTHLAAAPGLEVK